MSARTAPASGPAPTDRIVSADDAGPQTGSARPTGPSRLLVVGAVIALFVGVAVVVTRGRDAPVEHTATTFTDDFSGTDTLITNEFATANPRDTGAARSPHWEVTSGSFFRRDGHGWSGAPDRVRPDRGSRNGTNSAVFRALAPPVAADSLRFALRLRIDAFGAATNENWDGVHLFARYRDADDTYAVSVARRDGRLIIKKKARDRSSEGDGAYDNIAEGRADVPVGRWVDVELRTANTPEGTVSFELRVDGQVRLAAVDTGAGGTPPLTDPGRFGLRADNSEFSVDDVTVAPT